MKEDKQKQVQEGGNATFAVKVSQDTYDLVNILCEGLQHGTNGNDLMKKFIQTFIESAKHDGPLSDDIKTFLNMLKLEPGWHKAFNFADITARSEVAQVILILQQAGRHGFGLTMIDKPWMGEPTQTMCVDDIVERVIKVSMPGLAKRLDAIGEKFCCTSMRETLTILCDSKVIDILDMMDAEEMPGVGVFHDFGKAIEYGNKQKSYKHRTPDSLANSRQQSIRFDDDDREAADTEAVMGTGTMCSSQTSQGACPRDLDNDEAPEDDISEALGFRPFDQEQ